ncbi:MAG: M20/M25/M40 family metallo-hydrolase [Gemmatimonadetes bacterium]|nr:M20/M25/M40 family metallo-hydrolase [Gemmatimonadota bacterium]
MPASSRSAWRSLPRRSPPNPPPPDNPILRRIWALGMDSSQVEPLAQVLLDSIGPRLTGTDLQKGGNDWLVRTYRGWGIEAKNERVGTWRGWRRGHSHIDLVAPRQRTLEGTMLGFSPGTRGKNLDASTVILPRFTDSTEFVKWLPQAKGKFVLVAAPQPTCRPMENWEKNAPADEKVRMDSLRAQVRREWAGPNVRGTGYSLALGTGELGLRLEQGGVAGVITSRPKDAWGTIEIFDTYNTRAPAVALSCEDYGLVYRLTERNQGARLRLNLESQLGGEREVFNTVATIPGSEKPNEYVMLSAHFDSWDGSSGATDNGTGTIVMLEAMRILRQVVPHPKRTILVGHWTSEENGLVGSRAFSEDHPEVREGLLALFNQDNGTGRIVRTGAAGLPDLGARMASWLSLVPEPFRSQVQLTNPGFPSGGGSDDASFACWGLPATSLGAHGWDYGNYTWHTNRDTYDKVVWEELRGNATLTAMLAYLASEEPTLTSRERVNLAELAARAARDTTSGPRRPVPTSWPECQAAPRSTKPRLR